MQPNGKGIITPQAVAALLKPSTVFVSIGWANNELGVIQPLSKITQTIRSYEQNKRSLTSLEEEKTDFFSRSILIHSDGGQASLYEPSVVHSLGVDLLSLSASKLYGPHGVGCLYISNTADLAGVVVGGDQERGLRAGTENVALAVGFATAFELIAKERHQESSRLKKLRDELATRLEKQISGLLINGDLNYALAHMLNISIPNINSEYLCLSLDHAGFAVSTKSACNEGEKDSHVVAALGGEKWRAENTLRISLGRATKANDVAHFADALSRLAAHAIVPKWTSRN